MREVIFEGLKWYIRPAETTATPDKKKKGKRMVEETIQGI